MVGSEKMDQSRFVGNTLKEPLRQNWQITFNRASGVPEFHTVVEDANGETYTTGPRFDI